ncbi:Major facilitator superfamily domain general substrate transporter [Penicillium hispanicum]|uniref:Major facilitator superfamily domain general substrate transporter n=1 Tax=Penicillium hispanicum TaxID=1080232 RepID=UPI002540AF79|nr:Major facilitator superfamily domain general substrate transporter [Penicillium hispanicum]KAJ5585425.1 Major facilitator superfamily domain general substrate transporter [Penicillium hispanicum]
MPLLDARSGPSYGAIESSEREMEHEQDQLLQEGYETEDESSGVSTLDEAQEGVRKIEAINMTWTTRSLIVAYVSIFLMAFCTSLEGQTVMSLSAYATSAFSRHSLISTVLVVQNVVNGETPLSCHHRNSIIRSRPANDSPAVIKPPMAKIADVFGRFEAFCLSILIYVLGYVQMAASNSVQAYASAQIFYSAGSTGLQILQQVFIADSSDLLNRAFLALLPEFPFLITVWLGPTIAGAVLRTSSWRWGYGMWAIILPAAFLPLALSLLLNQRKARRLNLIKPSRRHRRKSLVSILRRTWYDLDVGGLMLLSAALTLLLVPLTLAANTNGGWKNASIIVMMVVGVLCLLVLPFYECSKKLAPKPLLSLHLLRQRTALAGCALAFWYFMAFYFSVQPYLYSYLQVVQDYDVATAGRVTQTFAFTSTIAAFGVSILIKYTRRYRIFVTIGCVIYMIGLALMLLCRGEGASHLQVLGTQVMVGCGGGLLNVPVQLGVQASASHQEVAAATAMFLTSMEMGGAIGAAVSGAIWSHFIPKKLQDYLPEETKSQAGEIFGKLTKALEYPMGSPTRNAINRSYQETMNRLLTLALLVTLPLIPLSLVMVDYKLDKVGGLSMTRTVALDHHD